MKSFAVIRLVVALILILQTVPVQAEDRRLDLLVVRNGWGDVNRDTVERLLYSVADTLWQHFPERKLNSIIVRPNGGPITLYQRGPGGEILIRLNTGSTYWSQYTYQFAHEFCHVLCNYDADPHGNDWFEESICEMASLFALRQMGEGWKTNPPFAHWKNYARHLTQYADDRMAKAQLPPGQTLAQWYETHAKQLHGSATKRDLNAVIANALLPMFEKQPQHWEAVTYLNDGRPTQAQTFQAYLRDWYINSPEKHRPFISKIAQEFGLRIADQQDG